MALLLDHNPDSNGEEIIYHLFQRSFFDANGDKHGDLKGVLQKLDYLQDLGVTALLLTPLYESSYYHNYFADNFELIDPSYGNFDDYFNLVRALRDRGMKLYLDMEIQYVAEDHEWYRESFGNPDSIFSDYIVYKDKEQTAPESILFDITGQLGYNGLYKNITTVNLLSPNVQEYMYRLFSFWIDPHRDGSRRDGVDGFRLDHMMDVLDDKPRLSNLFNLFWKPLLKKLKAIKPDIFFIAEQTDWDSFGIDYIERTGVDSVFAFPLREAFVALDKARIEYAAAISFTSKAGRFNPVVFIENHDTHRFATLVDRDLRKMKLGAAFTLLFPGIPAIYYGQEIGMEGTGGFGCYGNSDGNDIPRREAFKWFGKVNEKGVALWYKDSGPWWRDSTLADDDGVSVEEQQHDPDSLLNYYRMLIRVRKSSKALSLGRYYAVKCSHSDILAFARLYEDDFFLIVVNLSDNENVVQLALTHYDLDKIAVSLLPVWGKTTLLYRNGNVSVALPPWDLGVWKLPLLSSNRPARTQ